MARRQQNLSISLFPFLAVLVCTMGALILLLLVTTRRIRNEQLQAVQFAETAIPAAIHSEPNDRPDSTEVILLNIAALEAELHAIQTQQEVVIRRISELEAQLADVHCEYEQKATLLQTVRQDNKALQQQIDVAEKSTQVASLVNLMKQSTALQSQQQAAEAELTEATQRLQDERQKLIALNDQASIKHQQLFEQRSALLSLKKQLQTEQQKRQASTGTETILEFTNISGTRRTAIIIDLTEAGFHFIPNGIRLTERDMQGFPVSDNPLLTAVLNIHKYRSQNSVVAEPYVLMLVRPGGSLPFYTAQRIFTDAGIHYGYELVTDEQTITVEEADTAELQLVRRAVLETLARRETLYAVLRRQIKATHTGSEGSQGADKGDRDSRQLVIRPDGRIVQQDPLSRPGSSVGPIDGRFYAGGEAPPPSLARERLRRQREALLQSQQNDLRAATSRQQIGEGQAAYPVNELQDSTANLNGAFENLLAGQQTPLLSDTNPTPETDAASQFNQQASINDSGIDQNSAAKFGQGSPTADEIEQDMAKFLQDIRHQLAQSSSALPPADLPSSKLSPGTIQPSLPQETIESSRHGMAVEQGMAVNNNKTAPETAAQPSNQPSPLSQRFPSGLNSPAQLNDQIPPVGTAANSGLGQNPLSPQQTASGTSAQTGSNMDISHVDPALLQMLKPSDRRSTDDSTPVGITVFLDTNHMTIGQRSAQLVQPETLDPTFAYLLQAISEEVDAVRQSPLQPMMPIVKFVVSPGGERTRIQLARELRKIGIPFAVVFALDPHVTRTDSIGRASIDDTANLTPARQPDSPQAENGPIIRLFHQIESPEDLR